MLLAVKEGVTGGVQADTLGNAAYILTPTLHCYIHALSWQHYLAGSTNTYTCTYAVCLEIRVSSKAMAIAYTCLCIPYIIHVHSTCPAELPRWLSW